MGTIRFPESLEVARVCSRVAGENGHPSLDQLVQMRADRHGGCVSKDLLGREAMFRRSHRRLPPPLFGNLALESTPTLLVLGTR